LAACNSEILFFCKISNKLHATLLYLLQFQKVIKYLLEDVAKGQKVINQSLAGKAKSIVKNH